jgi:hypothetical protein
MLRTAAPSLQQQCQVLVAAAAGFQGAPQPPSPFAASTISKLRHFSANQLAGRNIFQLKAAVDTVEKQTAPEAPAQPAIVELPTSDESEKLLRIRHSVGGCNLRCIACIYKLRLLCSAV